MGIHDRDYMRRPDPGRPPAGSPGSEPFRMSSGLVIGIVLIFTALAAIIVQGFKQKPATDYDETAYYDALYDGGFEPVNVNTATKDQLLTIPMMSERIAEGIIEKRPFRKAGDLMDVRGVGEVNLEIFLMHLYGFEDQPEPRMPTPPGVPDA